MSSVVLTAGKSASYVEEIRIVVQLLSETETNCSKYCDQLKFELTSAEVGAPLFD